ncbi:hypothetical protein SY94_6126 (plasmid) [Agrobacterium tumefaciens]|nr:unknown [Agrobacterium fabrum str. C58]KJX85272.1 hypothetical protein SY94_6126 [Agrobacterium tumefaciens]
MVQSPSGGIGGRRAGATRPLCEARRTRNPTGRRRRLQSGLSASELEIIMNNIIATGFNTASTDGELDSLERELRRLEAIGVDTVELALSSLDLIAGGRIVKERGDRLRTLLETFSFRYTVHGLVSSNFMDPATRRHQVDAAKALVEICDSIDARVLVQHAGFLRADQIAQRAGADERQCEALLELGEHAKAYGIRIAFENIFTTEPGQYRQTPAEVAATVKAVNHPDVVALIDFSHAYLESNYRGLDFRDQLRAMAPVLGAPGRRLSRRTATTRIVVITDGGMECSTGWTS